MQKSNGRSVTAMVLLFTAAAVAMLWGLTVRWQNELREQVAARAEQRSMQLADAMAGQVVADFRLLDKMLLDLRERLPGDPEAFKAMALEELGTMPAGSVPYLSRLDASGRLVVNLNGEGIGLDLSDRPYFQALKTGGDRLLIGAPFNSRVSGEWYIPVGRPLSRDGRFDGALYLLVSPDFLAQSLKRLMLADDDIVALVHPTGQFVARSIDNPAAMGQAVPSGRPFLAKGSADSGTFRRHGRIDEVPRIYGWQRLAVSGLVMVVGLSESSVMAPLVTSISTSRWLTGILSVMLILGGLSVAWLLRRIDRGGQALREESRRLEDAQRMAKVGHWSLDRRTGEYVWSDEMDRICGLPPGADRLTFERFYEKVHPSDRYRVLANVRRLFERGGTLEDHFRIVMSDGSEKHLHAWSAVEQEEGHTVRSHGTLQDITEVRQAQLAQERMNNELEARVAARTQELGSLNKELEAFTYSVSHDLRTPLRSIHGFASLLEEEESEALSPAGRTHLRRIQDGARRMGLLITDLLTMSHQSRAVVNLQRVNLSELAQSVVQDIAREDPQRKVAWHIEPGLSAWVDPVLMRVVLQNLLGNAWKYTSHSPQAEIGFLRVGQVGGMAEFCVRDNGAGFDMAYVDQLFQPFKRLHAHHEFEGTGVGLASVHRLVQRHGGAVRAEGAVGLGAQFYFTLPDPPSASQLAAA